MPILKNIPKKVSQLSRTYIRDSKINIPTSFKPIILSSEILPNYTTNLYHSTFLFKNRNTAYNELDRISRQDLNK